MSLSKNHRRHKDLQREMFYEAASGWLQKIAWVYRKVALRFIQRGSVYSL